CPWVGFAGGTARIVSEYLEDRREQGFTLIELLIAIVVVGILAAVAIVGIAGLTNTGGKSACVSTADAARAASAAFYGHQSPNAWPTSFTDLTAGGATAVMDKQDLVITDSAGGTPGDTIGKTGSWSLTGTFSATGAAAPTFNTAAAGNCNN